MRKLIGDDQSVPQELYDIKLTQTQARRLKTTLLKKVSPSSQRKIDVVFTNRNTTRRYGYCKLIGWMHHRITLTKLGENVGTLIHELSHVLAGKRGHCKDYKKVQRMVVDAYTEPSSSSR